MLRNAFLFCFSFLFKSKELWTFVETLGIWNSTFYSSFSSFIIFTFFLFLPNYCLMLTSIKIFQGEIFINKKLTYSLSLFFIKKSQIIFASSFLSFICTLCFLDLFFFLFSWNFIGISEVVSHIQTKKMLHCSITNNYTFTIF